MSLQNCHIKHKGESGNIAWYVKRLVNEMMEEKNNITNYQKPGEGRMANVPGEIPKKKLYEIAEEMEEKNNVTNYQKPGEGRMANVPGEIPKKKLYEIAEEMEYGMVDIYKNLGLEGFVTELRKRLEKKKTEILTAWYAEHGFSPGNAVLVEERNRDGFNIYVRENTGKEKKNIDSAVKKTLSAPECSCAIKRTEVAGMGIIFAKPDCPIHGHLHGA